MPMLLKMEKNSRMLIVDDLIFTGNSSSMFEKFKQDMAREFEMTDIGLMSFYLGIEVNQSTDEILISLGSYTREILKKFKMKNCLSR